MTKYIVTDLGPIDWHKPGTDVTGMYTEYIMARLIKGGYVKADKPKRKAKKAVSNGN